MSSNCFVTGLKLHRGPTYTLLYCFYDAVTTVRCCKITSLQASDHVTSEPTIHQGATDF